MLEAKFGDHPLHYRKSCSSQMQKIYFLIKLQAVHMGFYLKNFEIKIIF